MVSGVELISVKYRWIMKTFKQITNHIESGGEVQEFTTQMEVVAYIRSMNENKIYLGHDKQISLEINAKEIDNRGLEFIFIDKEEDEQR